MLHKHNYKLHKHNYMLHKHNYTLHKHKYTLLKHSSYHNLPYVKLPLIEFETVHC